MPTGPLSERVARWITDHIRDAALPKGTHLGAQALADRFLVSRAPIVVALKSLETAGLVVFEPNRGFFVAATPDAIPERADEDVEDALYFALVEDRLSGALPERVTENELIRRYGVTRGRLQLLLTRIAEEGWATRLPGHGWVFSNTLSSPESYAQAYRFRAAVEVEAMLQPGFTPDPEAMARLRRQQQDLLDGELHTRSRSRLFEINADFHQTIAGWSGNDFFVDAIRRVDRLRRLMEYRASVDRERIRRQCEEHLILLDHIAAGDMELAAAFLRRHIDAAGKEKQLALG